MVALLSTNGSSPRTRGTAVRHRAHPDVARFIPADAGNGRGRSVLGRSDAVHPRGRGERLIALGHKPGPHGSSPRTRGTGHTRHRDCSRAWFIPADAGNGGGTPPRACGCPVHPRGRGERFAAHAARASLSGSSPRTRGTAPLLRERQALIRFIPADAGNGERRAFGRRGRSVHPRGRGERIVIDSSTATNDGSSPRTRGTGVRQGLAHLRVRFIPADAGNGSRGQARSSASSVHPRGRGERAPTLDVKGYDGGSSPRTRGTVRLPLSGRNNGRFIPADAGNGRWRRPPHRRTPVHPRGRGERAPTLDVKGYDGGSSPRTRGTGADDLDWGGPTRFIPADAGNGSDCCRAAMRATVHPRGRGEREPRRLHRVVEGGSSPRTRGTERVERLLGAR